MNKYIMSYQRAIAKIYVAALQSFNRKVGKEIFISMLKGRKDSKIVEGKYYENEYYGIFASFKGNEVANVFEYLIETDIIKKENFANAVYVYTNKQPQELEWCNFEFISYISDNTINIVQKEDEELYTNNPFFKRGGNYNNTSNAGVFNFNNNNGNSNSNNGFRLVLAIR